MNLGHEQPAEMPLPEVITCDFSDLSFDRSPSVEAMEPKDPDLLSQGWLWFNNLGVNSETGTKLYRQGQPLRAAQIRVFAADVSWRYGFSFATLVKTPLGKKFIVDEAWRFPQLCRYGTILFQPTGNSRVTAWQLQEATVAQPQEITLNSTFDILVSVNDQKGKYADNSGSFDLYIQVVR